MFGSAVHWPSQQESHWVVQSAVGGTTSHEIEHSAEQVA
jgi:hypothetical protein